MMRLAILLLAFAFTPLQAQTQVGKPVSVKLNGHTFTLPEGFTIDVVAKAPLVDRPVSASFDEQGRLYVTVSSGSNERGPQQAELKTHRVVRLESTRGDGVFDKAIVFADRIAMPQGALWHGGSLYVAAPPHIIKLTDTDGDGQADKREIWFDGKTVTGCMNDLHGPWLGPDGWIYWTKGAFADQTYTIRGKEWKTRASHVFRARPDGTGIEPVMTGGMDNPVGLAFTPTGDVIVSGTFFQAPADGKRDGLIHAIYGGIFGKDWDVIRDPQHKWTGPHVLPIMTHLGAAAACGLTRYESHLFGPDYQDNLFCCLFNMQKVTRHVLVPDGATFKTRDSDFVVSDQKDFHPTDVVEAPDGSLLVIDTGGWYKICCPTSQLVQPDVLGAIYRVRRTGAAKLDNPLGKTIDWQTMSAPELCKLLDDPRLFVRKRAIATLGRGPAAELKMALDARPSPAAMRNALWAATRLDLADTSDERRKLLDSFDGLAFDNESSVAQVALHKIGLRSSGWPDNLLAKLPADPHVVRKAAETISLRRVSSTASLLERCRTSTDRFMDHALAYALIVAGDPETLLISLWSEDARTRRIAMTAFDQRDAKSFAAIWAIKEFEVADTQMRETAWWIASRHPEWGAALSKHLRNRLAAANMTTKESGDLAHQLAKLANSKAIQELLAERLRDESSAPEGRRTVMRAMAQANLKEAPLAWLTALQAVLGSRHQDVVRDAAATVRSLRLPKKLPDNFAVSLKSVGETSVNPAPVRLAALAAVPGGMTNIEPAVFAFLRDQLKGEQPAAQRSLAAETLSKAKLDAAQLVALASSLKSANPLEIDRLLDAFAQSKDDQVGKSLLDALQTPSLRPSLRQDQVKTRLAKFSPALRKEAEPLLAALNADAGKQQARLEELLGKIKGGDIRRGQTIFNSQKSACVVCHSIGYLGGKIGPDLTRIAGIRSERDLLEAIVFPSASFVRSYEPILVVTTSGKLHNGLVKRDAPLELLLVTGLNQEVRLGRDEIEEIQPGRVSIMPAGLDQQLTIQELADLIAFLKACK